MFEKGNKLASGRPKGSKNTLPIIRDKLFRILLRRITSNKDLESVDTATLIKFASACLPKDMSLAISKDPTITYISNVPRPDTINEYVPIKIEHNNNTNIHDSVQPIDIHSVKDSTQVNITPICGSSSTEPSICPGKENSITPANGSHTYIEGSTGEGEFSNFQNLIKSQVNLSESFRENF